MVEKIDNKFGESIVSLSRTYSKFVDYYKKKLERYISMYIEILEVFGELMEMINFLGGLFSIYIKL